MCVSSLQLYNAVFRILQYKCLRPVTLEVLELEKQEGRGRTCHIGAAASFVERVFDPNIQIQS